MKMLPISVKSSHKLEFLSFHILQITQAKLHKIRLYVSF